MQQTHQAGSGSASVAQVPMSLAATVGALRGDGKGHPESDHKQWNAAGPMMGYGDAPEQGETNAARRGDGFQNTFASLGSSQPSKASLQPRRLAQNRGAHQRAADAVSGRHDQSNDELKDYFDNKLSLRRSMEQRLCREAQAQAHQTRV